MQSRSARIRQRAPIHSSAAGGYLEDAQDLMQRNRSESAASLLYEAAKSSINAVANLHGENPGPTDRKVEALGRILERHPELTLLREGWDAARKLHLHCDQHFLNDTDVAIAQESAIRFIYQMLAIFRQQSQG